MSGAVSTGTVQAASSAPAWRFAGASYKRQQVTYGYNRALRRASDQPAYPICVQVTVAARRPVKYGRIDPADLATMSRVEEVLARQAREGAVLAGQITAGGTRTFLLYTGSANLAPDISREVEERIPGHPVLVQAAQDPAWTNYRLFFRLSRRTAFGWVILSLFPLLGGAVMLAHYGAGWAIGEALALYAWIAPLLIAARLRRRMAGPTDDTLQRRQPVWLREHTGLAFVLLCYLFGTLFAIFPAMLAGSLLQPWACAAIGGGAGLVLTTAIWPSQRRYNDELRRLGLGLDPADPAADRPGGQDGG